MTGRRVLATEPGGGPGDMDTGSPRMKLSNPGIELVSLLSSALAGMFFTTSATREVTFHLNYLNSI